MEMSQKLCMLRAYSIYSPHGNFLHTEKEKLENAKCNVLPEASSDGMTLVDNACEL